MTTYPLAHDIHGNPIEVPPEVAYWRVRRQPSRQGRPSRVSGLDGAPLCIRFDADADDLRAEGCGPDKYRLDGLDANKQPVNPPVVAFTELVPTESDLVAQNLGGSDPAAYRMAESLSRAVDALTKQDGMVRMVESWQRTQTAVMVALANGQRIASDVQGGQPSAALKAQIEQFREIRKLIDGPAVRNAAIIEAAPKEEEGTWWEGALKALGPVVKTPAVQALVARAAGATPEQAFALTSNVGASTDEADDEDGDDNEEDDSHVSSILRSFPPPLQPVFGRLSTEERRAAARVAEKLDLGTLQQFADTLLALDPDRQLAKLRQIISAFEKREASSAQRAVFGALNGNESGISEGNGG